MPYEGIDDPNHIGFWFREKDSIDHNLTEVANVVWRFGRDNYEDTYDLEKVLNWQRECETALVQSFDSLHPGSNLTKNEKADSMASVLSHFLVDNEIETLTMSTLVDWGAKESFDRFRTATICKKVIEMKPDFEKEIKAYNSFCSKFITDNDVLNWMQDCALKDPYEAKDWFKKAANQGHDKAKNILS